VLVAGTGPPDVVELWNWTLEPGEAHDSAPHSPGTRELLLVLSGQVQLRVGPQVELLEAGQSASFRGDTAHGYANPDGHDLPSRFCLTVFQPNVGQGQRRPPPR